MPVKNPELVPLFEEVKRLLVPYARHFTVRRDEPGFFDLSAERDVVIDGRTRHGVFFAGLIVQKRHLGLYFMPVYADADLATVFGPELLARFKGKSCFHLERLSPELAAQIAAALSAGFDLYLARGWV
jgi:hypothetical protein